MEIVIVRVGKCNRCGWCCGIKDGKVTEDSCKHLQVDGLCSIYDERAECCADCGHSHKNCIVYPDLPTRKENPNCGYRFLLKDSGVEVRSFDY